MARLGITSRDLAHKEKTPIKKEDEGTSIILN